MTKRRVLFVCIHNSARSPMAEAWLNHFCGDFFEAQSAGLEPGSLNPLVVEVMKEVGVDISHKKPQGVFDLYKRGEFFSYVIAVCDGASAEKCPTFPGALERIHWSFPDPSKVTGTKEEKLDQIRPIRDEIKEKIKSWCSLMCVADKV
ncbi:MAG: arsenate reductase ArsC [Candidatus Omnitrophica bacterium CG12_big_fil_rev_8_21_14_0_65_50_5]|nr:MAG: arsenate reductase ArsC [Candidatus Omnitrophica bacterium CG12_big_fil_rev_8_21_14_0_65_50_5]